MYGTSDGKRRQGFTLVELAVLIVLLGVLAAFGVPRFIRSAESGKAEEAFTYLSAVRTAQERYRDREGAYCPAIAGLNVKVSPPRPFAVGEISAGSTGNLKDSWSLTLTRSGASARYGAYTVVFTEDGFDKTRSSITGLPDINPMGR